MKIAEKENNRYASIDGLRTYAAIGIIAMHMRSPANNSFEISGKIFNLVIPFFTNFVFLFMIVSAFCMCCGYYEKFTSGNVSVSSFYERRFIKIFPFFTVLVLLDFIMNANAETLIETFADLTLCFGLLPNNSLSVVGTGWFIGVIFVFYLLFPFFCCFLLKNKRRAWISFGSAVLFNISCLLYFFDADHVVSGYSGRTNIIFCSMFFMAGGIIYLYRSSLQKITERFRPVCLIFNIFITAAYFFQKTPLRYGVIQYIWMLLIFSCWLIYAIGVKSVILGNPVTKYLSGISMEIYLCHMMVFRAAEKLHLNYLFGFGWLSYITTVFIVLVGSILFSIVFRRVSNIVKNRIKDFTAQTF